MRTGNVSTARRCDWENFKVSLMVSIEVRIHKDFSMFGAVLGVVSIATEKRPDYSWNLMRGCFGRW